MSATDREFDERATPLGALAYRVAFRILGEREEARDVTQEALARAFARWSRVGPYDEAWITRVATNLALDSARNRTRDRHRGLRADRAGPGPVDAHDPAVAVSQRRELVAVLRGLSRRQREVVALRYLADLPEAEVAAALGCSVGTVKQHASRGLAALRAALDVPDAQPVSGHGSTEPAPTRSVATRSDPTRPDPTPAAPARITAEGAP